MLSVEKIFHGHVMLHHRINLYEDENFIRHPENNLIIYCGRENRSINL